MPEDEHLLIDHKEDDFVGYRYFDTLRLEPAFAFGHGLSYTTFHYSDLSVDQQGDRVKVRLTVSNTGKMSGADVVQLYVKDDESSLKRPEKELKVFQKVSRQPGASATVTMNLERAAFMYYDDSRGACVLEPARFILLIGSSSRDLRMTRQVVL